MITLDEIRERLKSQHSKISKVAKEAGLHPNAVYRLMREDSKPAYATVKALSDYLEGEVRGAELGDD